MSKMKTVNFQLNFINIWENKTLKDKYEIQINIIHFLKHNKTNPWNNIFTNSNFVISPFIAAGDKNAI